MNASQNYVKILFLAVSLMLPAISFAVTEKEMEQARTIAAKAYLRYANDGSGYLDDLDPKTMEELEAGLKPKEKENIKAFKAITVPTDYKSWDKDKLVEYWAVTAFQHKGLLEKGRGGRIRARSLINKMNVTSPQAQTVAQTTPQANSAAPAEAKQEPDSLLNEIAADENNILQELPEESDISVRKEQNYTWVYIMVLGILVAIVVALVVYAASVFKKKGDQDEVYRNSQEDSEEREHLESLVADKDVEIAMLNKKLESANRQNSELKSKLETLTAELSTLRDFAKTEAVHKDTEKDTSLHSSQVKSPLRSIFLGRANAKGIFVRADRTLNVGHSVFVLETSDGFSGTFKVADSPAAWSLALSNPAEYLETACTGYDLSDTVAASKIVTESSGTAVFEGGCWRVIRKAKIKYL